MHQNAFEDFNTKSEQDVAIIKQMRDNGHSEHEMKQLIQSRNAAQASSAKENHIAK